VQYNPAEIEQKWQKIWQQMGLDKTPENTDKPKQKMPLLKGEFLRQNGLIKILPR